MRERRADAPRSMTMLADDIPIDIELPHAPRAPIPRRGRAGLSILCAALALVALFVPGAILDDDAGSARLLHAPVLVVLTMFALVGILWRRVSGTVSLIVALVPAAAWTALAMTTLLASPVVRATDIYGNVLPSPFVVLAARTAAIGAVSSAVLLLSLAFFAALAVLSVKVDSRRSLSEKLDAVAAMLPIGALAISAFVHGATHSYVSKLHVVMWAAYGVLAIVALTLAPRARDLARIDDPQARAGMQRTAALVPVAFTLGVVFLSCAWPLMLRGNAVAWAATAAFSAYDANVGAVVGDLPRDLAVDVIIALLASGARILPIADVRAQARARWGRLLMAAIAVSFVLAALGAVIVRSA